MYKTAATELIKTARRVGVTRSFLERGYSPEAIKVAYVQQGLPLLQTESLLKEAGGAQWAARGARWLADIAAPAVTKWMKGTGQRVLPAGMETAGRTSNLESVRNWIGTTANKGLGGLQTGLEAYHQNPAKALWGGATNFGKGLTFGMFGEGKGIGGLAGKSTAAYGMISPFFQGNQ